MNIRLKNALTQSVKVSVLDRSGNLTEIHLDPYAVSAVLDDRCLDVHARQLVAQGVLKIRQVPA